MRLSLAFAFTLIAGCTVGQPGPDGRFRPGSQPGGFGHHDHEGEMEGVPWVLRLAIRKSDTQRYTGRRTIEFRRGPNTLRHEEYITRDGVRSRIEFPTGTPFAGQVIVEDEHERRHYFPDKNEIRLLPPRREEALERLARLIHRPPGRERLTLRQEPGETVAGYHTEQVIVSDPSGNVTQRLFIEPRSGVVLKRRLFDKVGTQFGFFAFSQINLNPAEFDASTFKIDRKGATVVTPLQMLKRLCKENGFTPLRLPESSGYRLESVDVMHIEGQAVLAQLYTSGKSKLSFFQVVGPVDQKRLTWAKRDFKVHSWQRDGHGYVLVANLEQDELARLGRMAR